MPKLTQNMYTSFFMVSQGHFRTKKNIFNSKLLPWNRKYTSCSPLDISVTPQGALKWLREPAQVRWRITLTWAARGHVKVETEQRGREMSWEQCWRSRKHEFVMPGRLSAHGPAFREFRDVSRRAGKEGHFGALISRALLWIILNPIN